MIVSPSKLSQRISLHFRKSYTPTQRIIKRTKEEKASLVFRIKIITPFRINILLTSLAQITKKRGKKRLKRWIGQILDLIPISRATNLSQKEVRSSDT
jgi:hypothetical protein